MDKVSDAEFNHDYYLYKKATEILDIDYITHDVYDLGVRFKEEYERRKNNAIDEEQRKKLYTIQRLKNKYSKIDNKYN